MKKYYFLLSLLGVFIAAFIGVFAWYKSASGAPGNSADTVRFIITKGTTATKIGTDLKKEGLVKSAFAFKLYTQLNDLTTKIPPGEFDIPKNLDLQALSALLLKGPTELWVTIPEGYRREQIPHAFIKGLELTGDEANTFYKDFMDASYGLEGYLFPDTYLFPRDVTGATAVSALRNTFDKKFAPTKEQLNKVGLSMDEVVTLASIIERETLSKEERPTVAGIYLNRIDAGWPLQADATVQYVLGTKRCSGQIECDWWQMPTSADIDNTASSYNTYKSPGLPPGPIANPGLTSLEAVVNPKSTDYWYYLHDSDGVIHYSKTLEEHNANIAKYLD